MAKEIERKFLVAGAGWRPGAQGVAYRQGYLGAGADACCTVRVRIAGERAFLTVKGRAAGGARDEYEYPIPVADAEEMLERLCVGGQVEKLRYRVPFAGRVWEVDEFAGENAPLVIAEVELDRIDAKVSLPPWVGLEVTEDPRYTNAALALAVLALEPAVKDARKPDSWYRQSGVIAVRVKDGAPQVLLVTSAGGKRWVIPKGIVDDGHSPASSAAKEAWEEAGVTGRVSRRMLGRYSYHKWNGVCTVLVYRLEVEEVHRIWPEAHVRGRKWFASKAAAARVGDEVLAKLILAVRARRARA